MKYSQMKNSMSKLYLPLALSIAAIFTPFSPSFAGPNDKTIKVRQAFPFLNKYLVLPPSVKDGFKLVYAIRANPGPLPEMHYIYNNHRTRIITNSEGVVANLPDLAVWENGTIDSPTPKPAGMRISISMTSVPTIPLSTNISVAAVNNSINDLKDAIRSAGPIAIAFPKQESIVFKGASSGTIVFSDGRRLPMARHDGGLIFSPLKREMRGAISLNFASLPRSADFER